MKRMSVLAILVLAISITAYSVAGTYAKYTTTDTISDKARVAKWYINELTNVSLFEDSYLTDSTDASSTYVVNRDADQTTTDVIAPGTSGSYTFQVAGSVETNYTIKATVVKATETNGLQGRVLYTLKKKSDDSIVGGADKVSLAELKTALEALYDGNTIYAAGDLNESEYTIEWEWVFENTTNTDAENATDTALGVASSVGTDVPEVEIQINLVVSQSNQASNV